MSDSELSTPAAHPADDQIEQCLRRVTRKGITSGDFTIKKARAAAEQELGLDAGFLKQHESWNIRSKEIIERVVDEDEPSPEKPKPAEPAAAKAGRKRKSDEATVQKTQPRKKARKHESEDGRGDEESQAEATSSDDDFSEATPVKKAPTKRKPPQKKAGNASDGAKGVESKQKARVKHKAPARKAAEKATEYSEASENDTKELSPPVHDSIEQSKDEEEPVKDESELSEAPEEEKPNLNGKATAAEDDESDMSVLIDEPPKKKRAKKPPAEPKPKVKGTTTKSGTIKRKAAGEEPTPDEEEIKRLQGWLVKCGIRKMWHRELADCNTSKAKIKHLKGMLEEAGMTPRYSNEKAKDIKERRELAAELEATQEYAKKWGQRKDSPSGDDNGGDAQVSEEELKPATRKPKGLVDFGDSGDDGSD